VKTRAVPQETHVAPFPKISLTVHSDGTGVFTRSGLATPVMGETPIKTMRQLVEMAQDVAKELRRPVRVETISAEGVGVLIVGPDGNVQEQDDSSSRSTVTTKAAQARTGKMTRRPLSKRWIAVLAGTVGLAAIGASVAVVAAIQAGNPNARIESPLASTGGSAWVSESAGELLQTDSAGRWGAVRTGSEVRVLDLRTGEKVAAWTAGSGSLRLLADREGGFVTVSDSGAYRWTPGATAAARFPVPVGGRVAGRLGPAFTVTGSGISITASGAGTDISYVSPFPGASPVDLTAAGRMVWARTGARVAVAGADGKNPASFELASPGPGMRLDTWIGAMDNRVATEWTDGASRIVAIHDFAGAVVVSSPLPPSGHATPSGAYLISDKGVLDVQAGRLLSPPASCMPEGTIGIWLQCADGSIASGASQEKANGQRTYAVSGDLLLAADKEGRLVAFPKNQLDPEKK
jgi:hypothetical protein